jgi:hypothetical protein
MLGCAPSASTTSATLLLTRGVHLRSFKELLGHCTTGIAADTHSHALLDKQDHVTRALEDALSCRVAVRLQYKSRDTLPGSLILLAKYRCFAGVL